MRKLLILLLCLGLAGCGAQDFETLGDTYTPEALPEMAQVSLLLTQDAVQAMQEEGYGKLTFLDGYTVTQQTLAGGDLDKTLRTVTGYGRDDLSLMTQSQDGCTRYDFVWTCAGEGGMELCRGSILDDGSYHYIVTAMAPEDEAGALTDAWNQLFASFSIAQPPADTRS